MDWLEKELSQALERKDPSPDFAARLAARVAAQDGAPVAAPRGAGTKAWWPKRR